jgi:uncharacterized protein YlxP (DUF503 family)
MIVGASVVELHIEGCQSLKAKRGVVRSIVQRVRNHFNLSVSEVGGQDTWQRAVLGLAAAGHDEIGVRRVLDQAATFIEALHLAEVRNVDIDVVDLPHQEGLWDPEDPEDPEDR